MGRVEQRPDRPGQLRLVQVAHDASPFHQADLGVLLGDDDDHGVRLLGDPERRSMTRTESLGMDRGVGQGQGRSRRDDRLAADHDSPIVQGCPRREERAQEVGRHVAVDHHAGLGHFLEAGLALEDDEGTVTVAREARRGLGDFGRHVTDGAGLGR